MKRSYRVRARIWMVCPGVGDAGGDGGAPGSSQGTTTDASDVTVGVVGDQNNGGRAAIGWHRVVCHLQRDQQSSIRLTVRTAALPVVAKWQPSTTLLMALRYVGGRVCSPLGSVVVGQRRQHGVDTEIARRRHLQRRHSDGQCGSPVEHRSLSAEEGNSRAGVEDRCARDEFTRIRVRSSLHWRSRGTSSRSCSPPVPGMIVAPSSMATGNVHPIGAGPFTVEEVRPPRTNWCSLPVRRTGTGRRTSRSCAFRQSSTRRANWKDCTPTESRFAYLKSPDFIHEAFEAGDPGFVYSASMAGVLAINQRDDRAAKDERVRKAIVAAVDPNTFNERVQGGFGEPGTDMFASWSQWHGSVAGNGFDPEAAKKYLAEAKADGYDGKLTYVGMNDPATQRSALTFQSLLQAVGFHGRHHLRNQHQRSDFHAVRKA